MGRYKYDQFKGIFSCETINAIIEDLKKSDDICVDDYDWSILYIRVKKANHAQRHRFKDTIEKLKSYINKTPFNYALFSTDGEKDWLLPFSVFEGDKMQDMDGTTTYGYFDDYGFYDENVVREAICNNNIGFFENYFKKHWGLKQYPKNVAGIHLLKVSQFSQITDRNRKTVEDWARKKLIASTKIGEIRYIKIEKTIENLEKISVV